MKLSENLKKIRKEIEVGENIDSRVSVKLVKVNL